MSDLFFSPQPGFAPASATAVTPRFDQGVFLMHLNRGRKLLEMNRLEEARVELEQALHLRPRDEMTLNLLGMIYFKLDMRSEAASLYRLLLEIHPEADVLHSNLGVLEFKNGRHEDARRRLETALLLNPKNLRPHLYLGLIERSQGNLDACLEHLEAAGAEDLIARLQTDRGSMANGLSVQQGTNADTGPMRAIVVGHPFMTDVPNLSFALSDHAEMLPLLREGRQAVFTVKASVPALPRETLEVVFQREIRFRVGTALHLRATADDLHVTPPDPEGMILLRGSGRLELIPLADRPGRVILVDLSAGQTLHIASGKLLAHESGVGVEGAVTVGQTLPGALRLSGDGVVAISAGRPACSLRMSGSDLLLVHPRDLVCWTGDLRARPASMGGLEQILVPGQSDAGAVTLEGVGEVVIENAV